MRCGCHSNWWKSHRGGRLTRSAKTFGCPGRVPHFSERERRGHGGSIKGSEQECGIYYVQLNHHQGNAHYAPSSSLIIFPFFFLASRFPLVNTYFHPGPIFLCCVCIAEMRSLYPYWFLSKWCVPINSLGRCVSPQNVFKLKTHSLVDKHMKQTWACCIIVQMYLFL